MDFKSPRKGLTNEELELFHPYNRGVMGPYLYITVDGAHLVEDSLASSPLGRQFRSTVFV